MPVMINAQYPGRLPINTSWLETNGERLLALCHRPTGELSILLVDDAQIAELNGTYRNKPRPTNVLAFPMNEGGGMAADDLLGDIVISLDTARREALRDGITLHQRINMLLIHGLLHLLGQDHERSEEEACDMAAREQTLFLELTSMQRRNTMAQLAINVDHVATLREARGGVEPDPVQAAAICELAGAAGIVVHLREDRRHIQDRDIHLLRQTVKTKLNLEMGASKEIIGIALQLVPDMITLVPEKRQELTTEGGLNVAGQKKKIAAVIKKMSAADIPVSLFIDPDKKQVLTAADIGATFVEIHTGRYADAASEAEADREFDLIAATAEIAYESGLRVYAGHGLNYRNTRRVAALDTIEELSIGHAVMARAILVGLDLAVREMLDQLA